MCVGYRYRYAVNNMNKNSWQSARKPVLCQKVSKMWQICRGRGGGEISCKRRERDRASNYHIRRRGVITWPRGMQAPPSPPPLAHVTSGQTRTQGLKSHDITSADPDPSFHVDALIRILPFIPGWKDLNPKGLPPSVFTALSSAPTGIRTHVLLIRSTAH